MLSELVKEIDEKQTHINEQMKKLLSFEKTFSQAWEVISQVTELNGSRPTLEASRIIQQLPRNFIERYQNAHSVMMCNDSKFYLRIFILRARNLSSKKETDNMILSHF